VNGERNTPVTRAPNASAKVMASAAGLQLQSSICVFKPPSNKTGLVKEFCLFNVYLNGVINLG